MVLLRLVSLCGIFLYSAACSAEPSLPPAQLGVSPPRIEVDFTGAPVNQSIKLYNYGNTPKQMSLLVRDINSTADISALEPGDQTLSTWMLLNPKEFVIEPGGMQVVRLSIRPKVMLEPGDHYAMLFLRQIVDRRVALKEKKGAAQGAGVRIGSNYGLPIIVHSE